MDRARRAAPRSAPASAPKAACWSTSSPTARLPIDIFTLDTGLLFPETYALWRALEAALRHHDSRRPARADGRGAGGSARTGALGARPRRAAARFARSSRCAARSQGIDAWITAIRRDQTAERADAPVVERDKRYGLVKVNPLVALDVDGRLGIHPRPTTCPYNPLHDAGYPSIGCWPCTTPVAAGRGPARRPLARAPEERMRPAT